MQNINRVKKKNKEGHKMWYFKYNLEITDIQKKKLRNSMQDNL